MLLSASCRVQSRTHALRRILDVFVGGFSTPGVVILLKVPVVLSLPRGTVGVYFTTVTFVFLVQNAVRRVCA